MRAWRRGMKNFKLMIINNERSFHSKFKVIFSCTASFLLSMEEFGQLCQSILTLLSGTRSDERERSASLKPTLASAWKSVFEFAPSTPGCRSTLSRGMRSNGKGFLAHLSSAKQVLLPTGSLALIFILLILFALNLFPVLLFKSKPFVILS